MTKDEALKLALEALEEVAARTGPRWALEKNYAGHLEAITALQSKGTSMTKDEQIKGMANPNRGSVGVQEAQPAPVQELTQWRDMVVVSLVREGVNKHRARELADHFAAQPEQGDKHD